VICEQQSRWAPALRTLVLRRAGCTAVSHIEEVRSLSEFESRLAPRRFAVGLLEVSPSNCIEVLDWLGNHCSGARRPAVVCVLHSFSQIVGDNSAVAADEHAFISDALREAGAVDVLDSPRQLHAVLGLAGRFRVCRSRRDATNSENVSITEWAWSLVPWQDD
jgi:hypothetical protein